MARLLERRSLESNQPLFFYQMDMDYNGRIILNPYLKGGIIMLNYYYKNGVHHFYVDGENGEFANGGWTDEYDNTTYYSVHTKRAEYCFVKGDDRILVITYNGIGKYFDGKLHGVDRYTHSYYNRPAEEKYFIEDNPYDGDIILEIKKLLDFGDIY